jgi:hypothetical protein
MQTSSYDGPRFTSRFIIRAPDNLPAAVAEAAQRQMTTTSEYARRAILKQLATDGIDPFTFAGAA